MEILEFLNDSFLKTSPKFCLPLYPKLLSMIFDLPFIWFLQHFFRKFRGDHVIIAALILHIRGISRLTERSNDDTRKLVGEVCALGIFQRGVMAGPDHQHWTLKTTIPKKKQASPKPVLDT